MPMNRGKVRSLAISKIFIEDLFGQFTYEFPPKDTDHPDLSRVLILYGDNGSGKTTILKLLYHLLSPSERRNHRTFLAGVPFKKFEVLFKDGTKIIRIS